MNTTAWRLDGHLATLASHGGSINLARPEQGLTGLAAIDGKLLGIRPAIDGADTLQLEDAYARGNDLVAHFKPTDSFPFRTEVYWRVEPTDSSASELRLSLIVSVQTDLLDTQPLLDIVSTLNVSTINSTQTTLLSPFADGAGSADGTGDWQVVPDSQPNTQAQALLVELPQQAGAWFEAIHPSDRSEALLACQTTELPTGGPATQVQWRLFSHFLEKGVIRRARVTAALLAAKSAREQAATYYQAFAQQAPPLTV